MKTTKFTIYLLTDEHGIMVLKSKVIDPESNFSYFELDDEIAQGIWSNYKDYEMKCYEQELMERDD